MGCQVVVSGNSSEVGISEKYRWADPGRIHFYNNGVRDAMSGSIRAASP